MIIIKAIIYSIIIVVAAALAVGSVVTAINMTREYYKQYGKSRN